MGTIFAVSAANICPIIRLLINYRRTGNRSLRSGRICGVLRNLVEAMSAQDRPQKRNKLISGFKSL